MGSEQSIEVKQHNQIEKGKAVYLIGDSVLDNFYWLNDPTQNLTTQLRDSASDHKDDIHCIAVDETETNDILHGIRPNSNYVLGRKENKLEPYPISKDGKVYALDLLKKIDSQKDNYLVLSVGGNDARTLLHLLAWSWRAVKNGMQKKGTPTNYVEIVKKLLEFSQKIILVFVYKPYIEFGSEVVSNGCLRGLGRWQMNGLYDYFREFYWSVARAFKLPIIDLTRTFDP